jgi:hypothetical protein
MNIRDIASFWVHGGSLPGSVTAENLLPME